VWSCLTVLSVSRRPFTPIGWVEAKLLWRVPELARRAADTLEVIVGRRRDTFSDVLEAAGLVVVLAKVGTVTVTLRERQNSAGSCERLVSEKGVKQPGRLNGLRRDSPMAKKAMYFKREGIMI
jgi:hypothetical protein